MGSFDRLKSLIQEKILNFLYVLQNKKAFSHSSSNNGNTETCIILIPGNIPTSDYYFQGILEQEFSSLRYINVLDESPWNMQIPCDSLIIIVRYLPARWLYWLARYKGPFGGLAFFMDDDLPQAGKSVELPFYYACKLAWRYALLSRVLARRPAELWVSTPELARRYSDLSPRLLEPCAISSKSADGSLCYFYHGTWAHKSEIEWLVPIVRDVQQRLPEVWFEIIGTKKVKKMFYGIPRVRVLHPMSWPDYLLYSSSVNYAVGLAPCHDNSFNLARSHCKFFDITRSGAAGVYSNALPYRNKIKSELTGLLCENEPSQWVEAIVRLLENEVNRRKIVENAKESCQVDYKGWP